MLLPRKACVLCGKKQINLVYKAAEAKASAAFFYFRGGIDISEGTFFALLIYQFQNGYFRSKNITRCCCSFTMYATNLNPMRKCLQNYCKIRQSPQRTPHFSMQNVEVYMLHSFSAQVYSFRLSRQFSQKNKSNICAFFVCISAICIFLFAWRFAIIIVYNGLCAEGPFKTMFSILGGEQK